MFKKKDIFVTENVYSDAWNVRLCLRRDARVAEEARLESVYTSKAYPGFESPSLRRVREGVQSRQGRKPLQIPISSLLILKRDTE